VCVHACKTGRYLFVCRVLLPLWVLRYDVVAVRSVGHVVFTQSSGNIDVLYVILLTFNLRSLTTRYLGSACCCLLNVVEEGGAGDVAEADIGGHQF